MKKLLLMCLFLAVACPVHAALSPAQFAAAMANSATYQNALGLGANAITTYNPSNYIQSGWYVSNGVEIMGGAAATDLSLLGAGSILAKRAMGFLGPVATAVTVGILAKDLYDLCVADKTNYPLLNAQAVIHGSGSINKDAVVGGTYALPDGRYAHITAMQSPCGIACGGSTANCNGSYPPGFNSGILPGASDPQGGCGVGAAFQFDVVTDLSTLPATPVTPETFNKSIETPSLDALYPTYNAEANKAIQDLQAKGLAAQQPTPEQIKALSDLQKAYTAQVAQAQATQSAVNSAASAQSASALASAAAAANPGNAGLAQTAATAAATAAAAQASLDKLTAAQTAGDLLTSPPLPPANVYDATIAPPASKSITALLTSFVASAPLVAMVKSFVITASGDPVVPIGTVYGQEMSFDFTRYGATLSAIGGIFLMIVHGFAVLVVMRGW